jgi:PPOX class probable F420-dependent enzyme
MPTIPDSHLDLLDTQVASLATIGPDGRPQVSAVWFLSDGGTLRLSLNTARQKTKNMMARPQATLFLLDLGNPARYLEVRGDVTIDDDDDYEFASKVGAKYGMDDMSVMDGPGERRVAVTIEPARVNAVDMSAG